MELVARELNVEVHSLGTGSRPATLKEDRLTRFVVTDYLRLVD